MKNDRTAFPNGLSWLEMYRLLGLLIFLGTGLIQAQETKLQLLNDVSVRLEPYEPFPYVEPGVQGKVSFFFTNLGDRELQLTWKTQIDLPSGKGPELEEKFTLPPEGKKRIAITDKVTEMRGVVTFLWQLTDQDGRKLALRDSLGVMTLPGPETSHRSSFRFGWGTGLVHFVPHPGEEKCLPTYAQMGIDLIRVGDKWAYSERNGDAASANSNTNYWGTTEQIVHGARDAGMDVLYLMWGTPLNLARADFSNESKVSEMAAATKTELNLMQRVRPPEPVAWRIRVKDTVTKFKDSVKFWEIWNDQDRYHDGGHHMPNGWVGNTDEYIELLREAGKIIKDIDPTLSVLNGGFFTIAKDAKHDLNPDMQERVTREAQDSFDIYAAFDTNPEYLLGPLADLRKELKTPKPLWLTRVEQRGATAEELVRRLISAKGCGASAFVWMWGLNFDSGGRGILMPMSSWKTKDRTKINVHSPFQMLPAGCAYVHAIGLLRMLPSSVHLDTGKEGQWVFAFFDASKKDSRQVVGLWQGNKMSATTLRLNVGPEASCSLLDIYGNAEPMPVDPTGTVVVPIKHAPAYVLVEKGSEITVLK